MKILKHTEHLTAIKDRDMILPIHMRLNITNRCNLACPWCLRSDVDRKLEMSFSDAQTAITSYRLWGCKAVTISGGGEPTMHKDFSEIINMIHNHDMKIGMLTNGWFLHKHTNLLKHFTWIRISLGDGRKEYDNRQYWKNLEIAINEGQNVDWGFSYVITQKPNLEAIRKAITFANEHNFTHIRMVCDISISNELYERMEQVKEWIRENDIDDSIVIYQKRERVKKGMKKCLVNLIRPIVDVDGHIYSCCGVGDPKLDYNPKMSVGKIKEIDSIVKDQKHINGSVCRICYLSHYNELLNFLTSKIKHEEFI